MVTSAPLRISTRHMGQPVNGAGHVWGHVGWLHDASGATFPLSLPGNIDTIAAGRLVPLYVCLGTVPTDPADSEGP